VALVGRQVTALSDLDTTLQQIVALIRRNFHYYQTHLLLVDEEAGEIALREASGPGADLIKARGLRLRIGQEGITGWVAHTGQALLCNDVSQEPRYHEEELLPETRAELAVPLLVAERVIGVLDVQGDRCGAFDSEDVTVLEMLGTQVAVAIENARLFEETRHRYEAMMALHQTSLDIISQLDKEELLGALLRRGVHLLGAEVASLWIYDPESQLIQNVANYNTERNWVGTTLRLGEGITGRVVATGEPLIVNEYGNWPGRVEPFTGTRYDRMVGVPLHWRDHVIGVIIVRNHAGARRFNQNDVWLLSQFADLAAIAVKNAELHMQVKEFSQTLERKVEQRTWALTRAKEEIAAKTEQLRSLLSKIVLIQQEEQARIARDMHDGVVQLITAARYELQAARLALTSGPTRRACERIEAARRVLADMEEEIRHVIYDLHPAILDADGLVPALRRHATRFQEICAVACDVRVTGDPYKLPMSTKAAVFRVVKEALHNVGTHAEAHSAIVTLDFQPGLLRVTVRDDGHGFDAQRYLQSHDGGHLGLLGMEQRVKSLDGDMEIWSRPGEGTEITLRFPIFLQDGDR
jgi:signal transduction histidine kinase